MVKTVQSKRILIVDDMPENIEVLSNILPEYEKSMARSGAVALKIAQSANPPALILLDVMMPGLNGYEVCQRLKADEKTRDIPVIFVTARDEVLDETLGFAAGGVDYITKPVTPALVRARVATHLSLVEAYQKLKLQYVELQEAETLRRDVEHITRHDLRSPLNGIMGFSILMQEDPNIPFEKRKRFLKFIENAGRRLLYMINQSLDLLKMEQGTYTLRPEKVNILLIIRSVIEENQDVIRIKKTHLSILLGAAEPRPENLFMVWGEESLCYSLFSNLILNALEASDMEDPVTITLEVEDMARVQVHNRGLVPEEVRDRFFEKFATHNKKGGTGLGTYIASMMAEIQKGTIQMQSGPGKGTILTVRLPLATTEGVEGLQNLSDT